MKEITAITPQIKDKRRCNIFIDGRFYCGLALETTVKYRLKVGRKVEPEFLSEIQMESEKNNALDKALTHISATRKTEKEVRVFLKTKGYLPSVCNYVIQKMKEYNFLNDTDYAQAYAEAVGKKKGNRLIKMELRRKGVSEEEIEDALSNVDDSVQVETAKAVLFKYMRGKQPDKINLQKAYKYLLGKGFDYEVAREALIAFGEIDDE